MTSRANPLRPEGAQKRKDIIILAASLLALLLAAVFLPAGEVMARTLSVPGAVSGVVPMAPGETVRIPFRAEAELLTEVSFYLLHFPEEEEGEFFLTIKDAAGQTLFETDKALSALPHEASGRLRAGVRLVPQAEYVCEIRHNGTGPEPGVRFVTSEEKPDWISGTITGDIAGDIPGGILMNMEYFRPRVFYRLLVKILLMVTAACCIIRSSVKLCRRGAA